MVNKKQKLLVKLNQITQC